MKKDQEQIDKIKEKQISEIKSYNKSEMFKPKQKISLLKKILIILGYGKKR